MSGNYPDGVSASHPYFNPAEGTCHVNCTADEVVALPYFGVKNALEELRRVAGGDYKGDGGLNRPANHGTIIERIEQLQRDIEEWKLDDVNYECEWEGDVDTDISEEAEWQCPRCGRDNVSDTLLEERDPDEEWERRNER